MVQGQGEPGGEAEQGTRAAILGEGRKKRRGLSPPSSRQQWVCGHACGQSSSRCEWKSRVVEARVAVGAGWEGRGTRVRPLDSARGLLEVHEPILWGFPKCFSRALA